MSDIEARVKKIIAEQLGVEESQVTNEKAFVADLGADSLDTVELVMALEDEFGIEIPDSLKGSLEGFIIFNDCFATTFIVSSEHSTQRVADDGSCDGHCAKSKRNKFSG